MIQDIVCLKSSIFLLHIVQDHVFAPTNEEIYPKSSSSTIVDPIGFESLPESISRPGHFQGVATVVTKLLNIIQPSSAYFGK